MKQMNLNIENENILISFFSSKNDNSKKELDKINYLPKIIVDYYSSILEKNKKPFIFVLLKTKEDDNIIFSGYIVESTSSIKQLDKVICNFIYNEVKFEDTKIILNDDYSNNKCIFLYDDIHSIESKIKQIDYQIKNFLV